MATASQVRKARRAGQVVSTEAEQRAALTAIQVRRCMYCGCTEDRACRLPGGDTCCWIGALCDVCSSPPCLRAHSAAVRRQRSKRRKTA
jgi:hypothetical protein